MRTKWIELLVQASVYRQEGFCGSDFVETGKILLAHTYVEIGEGRRVCYRNKEYVAVPFRAADAKEYWLLAEESGIDIDDVPGIDSIWVGRTEEKAQEIFTWQSEFFEELRHRHERGED